MPVFGQDQDRRKAGGPIIPEIVGRVNDNTKRLRLLEERERLLTGRISSLDESSFQKIKELEDVVAELGTKLAAQDEKIATLQNSLKEAVKQLKFLATKSDIRKLEETLKILDPIRQQLAGAGESGQQDQ